MSQRFATVDADGFVTGFYTDDIHAPQQIPKGAVAISDDTHVALLAGQSQAKRIKVDKKGRPQFADLAPPTREAIEAARRRAYADPDSGSDRFFVIAARMNVMGEAGAQEVVAQGVARYTEIRAALPWPPSAKMRKG